MRSIPLVGFTLYDRYSHNVIYSRRVSAEPQVLYTCNSVLLGAEETHLAHDPYGSNN
jgi:hypothetical protein